MTITVLSVVLLQGLGGFLHCPMMCGPFAIALGTGKKSFFVQLTYNLARTVSYSLLGFALGFTGDVMNRFFLDQAAGIVGGILLLYFGLSYMFPGILPGANLHLPGKLMSSLRGKGDNQRGPFFAAILFGSVSGFLPCGLLYPAFALSLSTGGPVEGAVVMAVFGLGTIPSMLLTGLAGNYLTQKLAGKGRYILGALVIAAGIFMIVTRLFFAGAHNHGHDADHSDHMHMHHETESEMNHEMHGPEKAGSEDNATEESDPEDHSIHSHE